MYVIDSTTIKLFQAIFKGAGPSKENGRRKGGLKVHMAVQTNECVPSIIHLSQAASSDKTFNKYVNFPREALLLWMKDIGTTISTIDGLEKK